MTRCCGVGGERARGERQEGTTLAERGGEQWTEGQERHCATRDPRVRPLK